MEDSEFEQGLEMPTVALAFSYIILLRIAGAPWTQLPTSLHSFFRVPLSELDDFQYTVTFFAPPGSAEFWVQQILLLPQRGCGAIAISRVFADTQRFWVLLLICSCGHIWYPYMFWHVLAASHVLARRLRLPPWTYFVMSIALPNAI